MKTNPDRVICTGTGLHFGYFNRQITAEIDTRQAGPGELTVYCNGPKQNAYCSLHDHKNGIFTLSILAQDIGMHELHIQYDGLEVKDSPFDLQVSPASLVIASGTGLHNGLLKGNNQGVFKVDTTAAGQGDVKIRVGGPQGGFKVKTRQLVNRILECNYHPKQVGTYSIHVYWNNDHVVGSPFHVRLVRKIEDLNSYDEHQV